MDREASASPSSSSPPEDLVKEFIGTFVSVTSKDDKRYEGVVSVLNLEDSSMGLQNVRCYGREGTKKINEQRVIQLLYEVNDYILFRGSDIKDIQVLSLPPPPKHIRVVGNIGSIITTEDVRCEGLITHVNIHDSLIFMKDVVCYGTEGRERRRKRLRFAPCNQLATPTQFQFRDIRDLEIIFLKEVLQQKSQETARESSDFPPLSKSHIGHGQGSL